MSEILKMKNDCLHMTRQTVPLDYSKQRSYIVIGRFNMNNFE